MCTSRIASWHRQASQNIAIYRILSRNIAATIIRKNSDRPGIYRERPPGLQSPCSCPPTPWPRLIRSKVSVGDLQRAPATCSTRPVHRPKMQVAACSRGDASYGLFVTSPCTVPLGQAAPARHATYDMQDGLTTPGRIVAELYGLASRAWVKIRAQSELLNPSSADLAAPLGFALRLQSSPCRSYN